MWWVAGGGGGTGEGLLGACKLCLWAGGAGGLWRAFYVCCVFCCEWKGRAKATGSEQVDHRQAHVPPNHALCLEASGRARHACGTFKCAMNLADTNSRHEKDGPSKSQSPKKKRPKNERQIFTAPPRPRRRRPDPRPPGSSSFCICKQGTRLSLCLDAYCTMSIARHIFSLRPLRLPLCS